MEKLRSNIFSNISHSLTYHHFSLFTIIFSLFTLLILSCSSPTENSSANLSGTISLINDSGTPENDVSDFSGITIALYNLAYLDTTIKRINNDYPQIGVQITQHTEFDHRFQVPVATTTTNAEGFFSLEVSPGTYNLVALKDDWGWRYVYEISLSDGDNELADVMQQSRLNFRTVEQKRNFVSEKLKVKSEKYISHLTSLSRRSETETDHISHERSESSISPLTSHISQSRSDISLFPIKQLSGYVDTEVTIPPFHHLVCTDDVTFAPGSYFELQPNSVCRIVGGKAIEIFGSTKLQGEEDGMFVVTSNEGYAEFPTAIDSLTSDEMIRKIEIGQSAEITNDEIKWGCFSWLNNGIQKYNSSFSFAHNILTNGSNAFSNSNGTVEFSFSIMKQFSDLAFVNYNEASFHDNIIKDNYDACRMSESNGVVQNNYFYGNYISVRPFYGFTEIRYNCFEAGKYEIAPSASGPIIRYNLFKNSLCSFEFNTYYTQGGNDYCQGTIIENNNFKNTNTCVKVYGINSMYQGGGAGRGLNGNQITVDNCWYTSDPESKIQDVEDEEEFPYDIIYDVIPNPTYTENNAGIQ